MTTAKSVDKATLMKWLLVALVVVIGIAAIPVAGVVTQPIKNFLLITVAFIMIIALDMMPSMIPALLLPFAYILGGVTNSSTALSPWTNTLIYMVIASLVFTDVMIECGLLRRIALMIINKAGASFMGLVFALYAACLVMSYISFCQGWLIMASLAVAICKTMNYKAGDKESVMLMMAVLLGSLSTSRYTYEPSTCSVMETALKQLDPALTISVLDVTVAMAPYILICLLVLFLMGKILKIKNVNTSESALFIKQELNKMGPVSVNEKKALISLIFLIVFVMTSNWHGMGAVYGFVFAALYLYLPGIDLGSTDNIKKVNIQTPVFMVACMSIGTVATAIGINNIICDSISALMEDAGAYKLFYAIFGIGGVAKLFMTPLGLVAALADSVVTLASHYGVSALGALYTLQLSADILFFPYQNAWVLVVFSLGMMKMKDFIKWQAFRTVLLTIGLGLLFIPWWGIIGVL